MLLTSWGKCFNANEREVFSACQPLIFSDVFELTIRAGGAKPKPVSL